jgi:hypothetical protein
MTTTLWTLTVGLACVLLAFTTYAAFVGLAGVLSGARYAQCPRCHHHYLSGRAGLEGHLCPHGVTERVYQVMWRELHHQYAEAPRRALH